MADNVSGGLPNQGATYHGGKPPTDAQLAAGTRSTEIEGTVVKFADVQDDGYGPHNRISGQYTYARLCRNVLAGGETLQAGQCVTYAAGFKNRRIGAVATSGAFDGIVDDQLNGQGCVKNDLCWILFAGPAYAKNAGGVTTGDALQAGAAGAVATGVAAYNIQDTADADAADGERTRINLMGRHA